MKRQIDKQIVEQSKTAVINNVMDQIYELEEKKLRVSSKRIVFAFSLALAVVLLAIGVISSNPFNDSITPTPTPVDLLNESQSTQVATVGYISGVLLSNSIELSTNNMYLSNTIDFQQLLNEVELENNIDEFHVYFEMLVPFLDEDPIEDVLTTDLVDEEYEQRVQFFVQEQEYILYINVDETTFEGELVIDGITYDVTGEIEQYQEELQLKFEATNESGFIEVEYKYTDGSERKFEIKQNLNGIELEKELKVEYSNSEYKVELTENEDSYEVKKEVVDGEITYKLEYEVDGASGEAIITEVVDEFGNKTYHYVIDEDGEEVEIDKDSELDD